MQCITVDNTCESAAQQPAVAYLLHRGGEKNYFVCFLRWVALLKPGA